MFDPYPRPIYFIRPILGPFVQAHFVQHPIGLVETSTSHPLNLPPTCMSNQIATLSLKFNTPATLPCPLPSPTSPTCMHAYPSILHVMPYVSSIFLAYPLSAQTPWSALGKPRPFSHSLLHCPSPASCRMTPSPFNENPSEHSNRQKRKGTKVGL